MRRFVIALLAPLALAACAGAPKVPGQDAAGPRFAIEEAFRGRGAGDGVFVNALTGSERRFTVAFDGRWNGRVLTLREKISYADGERELKTWRLTKVGPDRYEGRREDVVGVAEGRTSGNTLRLSYDAEISTSRGSIRVHFEDTLVLRPGGVIENRAQVSKLGVPVGTVDLDIRMRGRSR